MSVILVVRVREYFFAKYTLKKGWRVKTSLNANISITKYNMKKSQIVVRFKFFQKSNFEILRPVEYSTSIFFTEYSEDLSKMPDFDVIFKVS